MSVQEVFKRALLAQFVGVTIALIAFFGIIKSFKLDATAEWCSIGAFSVAYLITFVPALLERHVKKFSDEDREKWISRMSWGDLFALSVLVFFTGGTKGQGSIYSAIFLIMLPTVAIFLRQTRYHKDTFPQFTLVGILVEFPRQLTCITILAIVFYLLAYFWHYPLAASQGSGLEYFYLAVAVLSILYSLWINGSEFINSVQESRALTDHDEDETNS